MPGFLLIILSIFDISAVSGAAPATAPATHYVAMIRHQPSANLLSRRPGVDTVSLQELQSRTLAANDTLYIVNFWATWCKPCVKELPFFEEAGTKFADYPLKILLVSLDMLSDIYKVDTFAATHLRNEVYLLRAGNPDVWINAIDPQWSGAIPATAFYRKGKKLRFHEGEFTRPELFDLIHSFLQ